MTLDTLFTEAADAGGPPTFDDDDIARRVAGRRRRRRTITTVAAGLVVVACCAAGLALATRGGEGTVADLGPTVEPVPVTAEAIVGNWSGIDRPDLTASFDADGTYLVAGCAPDGGTWSIQDGDLALADDHRHAGSCGPVGGVSLYTQFSLGVPTLYADGVLRVVEGDTHTDLVRDGSESPEPSTPRSEAPGTVTATPELVRGTIWAAGGASLVFDDAAGFTVEDCSTARGHWTIDSVGFYVDRWTLVRSNSCPPPAPGDRPNLNDTLDELTLTTDGRLIAHGDGAVILTREDAAAPDHEDEIARWLTSGRWVVDPGADPPSPYTAWVEFEDDGTFAANGTCGSDHGTWTETDAGADLTVTAPGPRDCIGDVDMTAAFGPIRSVELTNGDGDGAELTAHFAPATGIDGGEVPVTADYVPFAAMPAPDDGQLRGDWSTGLRANGSESTGTTVGFGDDGLVALGSCPIVTRRAGGDDGVLTIDSGAAAACVTEAGLASLVDQPLEVRLAEPNLLLWSPSVERIVILSPDFESFHDTQLTVDGPLYSLRAAYDEMGVVACCHEDLASDDHVRQGFVWAGQQILVQADLLEETSDLEDLSAPEPSADGRAVAGSTSEGLAVRFDCGGYRFTLSAWVAPVVRGHLLDAEVALADALPCEAAPPS